VSGSGFPSKNASSTSPKHRSSGAARWNSVIDERSFCASMPPKTSPAERPPMPATTVVHSRSRGPSTGCAR
jgi:hypothetical protein